MTGEQERLPSSVYSAFRHGNRRFGEDLNAEMASAVALAVRHRVPVERVLELLALPGNAEGAGRWWHRRVGKDGHTKTERAVRRVYEKFEAQARVAIQDCSRAREVIAELRHMAAITCWPGRTGASDQRAYLAVLEIAMHAGRLSLGVAVREVARVGMLSPGTVVGALRRLEDMGLLRKVDQGHGCQSATIRLVQDAELDTTILPLEVGQIVSGMTVHELRLHPLFQYGQGFDSDVVLALDDDPQSEADIAAQTGKSRRQVKRALARLIEIGAADRSDGGWVQSGERQLLDDAADQIGLVERNDKRIHVLREQSRMNRLGYHEQLARRARARQARRRPNG